MRLKEIHIKGTYKNLQDFKVSFEGDNFLEVFVGKNGTGKSNFFEAILEIFKHLIDQDRPIFNYAITYEIDGETIYLEWRDVKWINKEAQDITPDKSKLPENILVYYSGHNKTIGKQLKSENEKHKTLLNSKRKNENLLSEVTRRFTGIDNKYKSLLLSVILLQEDTNKAKLFIKDKLGIATIGNEIRLDFKRPDYANVPDSYKGTEKDTFNFDEFDNDKRFWLPKGYFKTLLNEVWTISNFDYQGRARDQGKINEDEYILYKSFSKFQETFQGYSPLELFIAFDNLKTIGYLNDIKIDITLTSGKKINIDQFSDGQFQSIYIYALTELFKDKNCITLLDEPDSFLHPEWQHKFLSQVNEISEVSAKTNHVLMSSHSGITLIPFVKDRVKYFDFKSDGSINNYPLSKRIAIGKLSNSLISYTEQEQILSIVNTIQIENKPVLFTEGKTDPLIIKEAWNKLYPEDEIPFIPFYAFGHRFVAQIMQDPEVISDMNGLPIFGLFDFDKGFNTWNGFSTNNVETDIHRGLTKQIKSIKDNPPNEVFAIMLPTPEGLEITNQVINPVNGNHWGDRSLMAIEHLFMHHPNLTDSFIVDESRPDGFKKFTGSKVRFAKDVVPTIEKEYFEVLEPMFEFINSKI